MIKRSGGFLAGLLTGLLASGLVLLLISKPRGVPVTLLPAPSPAPISVHVAGAVARPGVYQLPHAAIVEQALQAAGGPLSTADLAAVNLAARLQDGQQLFLPEIDASADPRGAQAYPADDRIPVNSASAAELERLPGIGPVLAQNMIDYRQQHGPFSQAEDLLHVPGIGPATLEAIRDLIRVP